MLEIKLQSDQKIQAIDIKDKVQALLEKDADGVYMIFCPHATAALTITENEIDLMSDYQRMAENLLSPVRPLKHCGHGVPNGEAHLLSALMGVSILVPVEKGQIKLGKWQSILFMELDGPRERKVWVRPLA